MEFRVLGPLEVWDQGRRLAITGEKQRALLALLLLHANRVVSIEQLIDGLWGEQPPRSGAKAVQVRVSQLRRAFEGERVTRSPIMTRAPGYLVELDPDALDLHRFERAIVDSDRALAANDPRGAAALLRDGLALWRGQPLAEFASLPFAQGAAGRLEELRLAAVERRIEADLALGRHADLVGELGQLITANPYRERLRAQLMLALYRSGRQAEAVDVYQETRRVLVDELGIEPSESLRQLERAILRQEANLGATDPQHRHAPTTTATSLPAATTLFIGRGQELAGAKALLRRDEVRLLTLVGPGGVGKTRLAMELAAWAADDFEHGAFWIPLASIDDSALVELTIAQTVGATDGLAEYLAGKRALLVLDNFEHVTEAALALPRLLAGAPGVKLLVTSREPLHLCGELEFPVLPLSEGEAVELFATRARVGQHLDAVAEICRRLDCLPLAVELAAARTKVLPPPTLLARLDHSLPLLTGGPRDAPKRHRALRDTIEWSYDLLHFDEQQLLARLGVFVGGFTLASAEDVCGATVDQIQSLVDKSLLQADEGRCAMLQTIREYALERSAELDDADELRARHADYFLRVAERYDQARRGELQSTALDALEAEHGNMRAALAWSGLHRPDLQMRLTLALAHLWLVRGYHGEARKWFEELLARNAESGVARTKALCWAANFAWMHGEDSHAKSLAQDALGRARRGGDARWIASALIPLGVVAVRAGDFEHARSLFEQSADLFRELGDGWELALSLSNLGDVARTQGHYERAKTLYEGALAGFKEQGDERLTGWALCNLGLIAVEQGHSRAAWELLEQSLQASGALRDCEATAYVLEGIAAVAASEGQAERAVRLLAAGDSLLRQMGAVLWPVERRLHERTMAAATSQLGQELADATWAEGIAMTLDDAVAYGSRSTAFEPTMTKAA
jgi:predicted ATPase/DNA-binding SARP family transcriptional activator